MSPVAAAGVAAGPSVGDPTGRGARAGDSRRPGAPVVTRVVHVPAEHDYVRHATTLPGGPAPVPSRAPVPADRFSWSDAVGWLARNGADVDVLHLHFGMEQVDLAGLAAVLDAADRAGVPVVWTVHDLTNPHLVDQDVHEAQVGLLARRCAGLLTLTPGAADEVERRWARRPVVVPHPHLAPLPVLARRRPPPGRPVVGVPLGPFRPAVDLGVVGALLDPGVTDALAGAAGGPVVLRVSVREEVLDDAFPRADARARQALRLLQDAHAEGRLELHVGPRTPDPDLWDELAGLAALVLPYRWGTHSGWVEACHDVGTPVVAPDLGRWGEQHRLSAYRRGPDGPDPGSFARALADALARGPRQEPVLDERLRGREASVAEHARLHALAAAGGRW